VNPRAVYIARLTQKGDHRELAIAAAGGFKSQESGVSDKDRIGVVVEGKADGMYYRITPKEDLLDGEYNIALDETAIDSYDFGISGAISKQ
jgi:hypothetical protein